MFFGDSERPRDSISITEVVVMQLKKMTTLSWKFGKELLLFCSVGALCGAAIGFFRYLHLGPFKTPEDAGYAAGLFVKSGVQLSFTHSQPVGRVRLATAEKVLKRQPAMAKIPIYTLRGYDK